MPNRLFQWIGMAATRIRFSEIKYVEVGGSIYWAKRRLLGSSILVLTANNYARAVGLPMRMLTEHQWLEYESRVFAELLGSGAYLRRGKQLFLPHAPGEPLRNILAHSDRSQKQVALELATRELTRLHQQRIHHPLAGRVQPFSHADATPGNVMVDLERQRATWLDFETIHPACLPIPCRRADDLRTLLCGLTAILPAAELSALIRTVLSVYTDAPVLTALRESFSYWSSHPRARFLAVPLTETQWRSLSETVSE